MSTALIRTRSLEAGYGGHPFVMSLDLEVHPGQVVALLGPNGAGKSTTLMTLAGHLPSLGGELLVDGRTTKAPLNIRAKRGMGLVTEDRSVFFHLTTMENLRLGRGDIEYALELFPELKPLLKRPAGLLSGGEQQMLTVGRALSRKPRVLLLDELSLGLAPLVVVRLLDAVRRAADEGIGVILVEQHIQQALRISDYAYVMRRGRVIFHGPAAELAGRREEIEQAYLEA